MECGACVLSSVPVRREPVSSSEMTSQLLFGEVFRVVGERSYFVDVESGHDGYRGWIDRRQGVEIGWDEFEKSCAWTGYRLGEATGSAVSAGGRVVPLVRGARLQGWHGGRFELGGEEWMLDGEVDECGEVDPVEWVMRYEGAPYLWGGRSPFGVDCSGLVQVAWGMAGVGLGRDTGDMVRAGSGVEFGDVASGDLVFAGAVADEERHVAMVVPGGVIHASARVRIDRLEPEGIVCAQSGVLTHRMSSVRRVSTLG